MDPESPLEQLYRDALYEVDLATGTTIIRIGEAAPTGLPVPLAVVSAWNPGAARPGEAENQAANRRLLAEITRRGWRWFPARGRDAAATHVEPSFAITGITREEALALGHQFGQAAIVFIDGEGVSLLWCG